MFLAHNLLFHKYIYPTARVKFNNHNEHFLDDVVVYNTVYTG